MDSIQWIIDGLKKPGKTQSGLANAIGRSPSAVVALLKGQRELKAREIPLIRDYLEAPESKPETAPASVIQEVTLGPDVENLRGVRHDIPVLGITVGVDDPDDDLSPDFWMNGEIVNYVARPRGLANAKNVFSVYVGGTSMVPRYRERDLVIVQKAPPAIGDDIVIEMNPKYEGADHGSFIKELVAKRGSYITVRQYNPPKDIDFDLREILNLFRVIPMKELIG